MSQPMFSVLSPVYNGEAFLEGMLGCLGDQTDPDWEAVMVDDGSTDKTPEILATHAAKDPRIRVFSQPNSGAIAAAQRAFKESRGRWVCNLAVDDVFDKNKFAVHREWFNKHPDCCFFYTHFWLVDEGKRVDVGYPVPVPGRQWQVLLTLDTNLVHATGACVSREAFLSVKGHDPSFPFNGDYDLWLRLLARHPAVFIPEKTCGMRMHADSFGLVNKDACLFDAARSGIRFLNEHPFQELFPLIDLSAPEKAVEAVRWALFVATTQNAYLYQLGPHPALISRLLEWAWSGPKEATLAARPVIGRAVVENAQRLSGTKSELIWKAAATACHTNIPLSYAYTPVTPSRWRGRAILSRLAGMIRWRRSCTDIASRCSGNLLLDRPPQLLKIQPVRRAGGFDFADYAGDILSRRRKLGKIIEPVGDLFFGLRLALGG